jgi:low temperature requirement protein LtrA
MSAEQREPPVLLACALVFATMVALWALYFGGSDRLVSNRAESTTDTIRAARMVPN